MSEDSRIRANQAIAAIESAGWVFDEYVKAKQDEWLNSSSQDHGVEQRERIWRMVHAALSIKAQLILTINSHQNEEALREHRDKRNAGN